jgi:putative methylase
MQSTEEFLIKYYADNGLEITHIFRYEFPIPKIYDFHNEESRDVKVVVLRVENFES